MEKYRYLALLIKRFVFTKLCCCAVLSSAVNFVAQFYFRGREKEFHIVTYCNYVVKLLFMKLYSFSNFCVHLHVFPAMFIRKSMDY